MAHNVSGMKVLTTSVNVNSLEDIKSCLLSVIDEAANKINSEKNIHPGKVAFLLPDSDYKIFLSDSIKDLIEDLNDKMKSKYVNFKTDIVPQFSTSVMDSFLSSHDMDIKQCHCKFFVGPVSRAKGLTIQVVNFLPLVLCDDLYKISHSDENTFACVGCSSHDCAYKIRKPYIDDPANSKTRSTDTGKICAKRTWPEYAAITRSSCEFHVTNLMVEEQMLLAKHESEGI